MSRVYTEPGIAMLANLLRSDLAIQMSVFIVKVFVQSRATSAVIQSIDNRLVRLEMKSTLAHAEIDAAWRLVFTGLQKIRQSTSPNLSSKG